MRSKDYEISGTTKVGVASIILWVFAIIGLIVVK